MIHLEHLKRRAELLDQVRTFFKERGFLEVETPLLSAEAIPEQHIGLFSVDGDRWLQASPEMHHKQLLCAGSGPIFEVTRSFRRGESGRQHRFEFTLLEWYRPGDEMQRGMDLLDELMRCLLGAPPAERTSYREAFEKTLGVDPHQATVVELQNAALAKGVDTTGLTSANDRDEWLNILLDAVVEPTLGEDRPELLYHYPATQAALACLTTDEEGIEVAERFELYWNGLELANGYHELRDPIELRRRLELANAQRAAAGAEALPLPERLLAAMTDPGLPPCAGVALGFDRLVMLATGSKDISEVTAM